MYMLTAMYKIGQYIERLYTFPDTRFYTMLCRISCITYIEYQYFSEVVGNIVSFSTFATKLFCILINKILEN